MKPILYAGAIALAFSLLAPAVAQEPMAVLRANTKPTGNAVLPANTEVLLKMNQEVTTKGKTWSEGDTFKLSVANDVMLGDYIIIPEGSPAFGRITWLTSRGAFGKSGKMDIELEHVEVNGRRIRLDGTFRQEGEGNTLATVGGVLAAGPFAGFITGHSGRIPEGRELMATTEEAIELAIPASEVFRETKTAPFAPNSPAVAQPVRSAPIAQPQDDGEPSESVELDSGGE